ncbi:uncharacterized protein LOC114321164 [Camellia sinensis]|uniref:Uncharacterized protein n=1 Tax=Camellia sinensis var. sinensis TaxID=542762 RepID=A0A4S4CWG5_CAMSN|nr:uncharacterized protein LOC114321164 [Camellia sinensis]THF94224.1 hypothetical protein TEA_027045 [Camellia sinensis var. sinensis]
MGSRGRRKQRWSVQALTPLMEGPDLEMQDHEGTKKESSWDVIREWFRLHKNNQNIPGGGGGSIYNNNGFSMLYNGTNIPARRQDLRLLLGVLGCPLAPIPLSIDIHNNIPTTIHRPLHFIKDIPIESSTAHYIIQQYLAATGCLEKKQQQQEKKSNGGGNGNVNGGGGGGGGGRVIKNMYTTGMVKMICCETEISSSSSSGASVKSLGRRSGENGCFVLWQMNPGMWSLELVLGGGSGSGSGSGHHHKVIAGSDGKIIWRHTPWLGTHLAKGPHRPLRRIIQGLDPKSTARLFEKAQCLGEKRIGEDDCFVLKVAADREAVMERSEGPAEVIRHVLYGYFSQKSGLLIYMEDSHLIRVSASSPSPSPSPSASASGNNTNNLNPNNVNEFDDEDTMYWETTIGSSIGDYRDVDGVLIAHQGRTIATVFRFGDLSMAMQPQQQPQPQQQGDHNHHHHQYMSRTRLEEVWRIDDVVFNVPGLSLDSFIPPADIFHHTTTPAHTPLFHSP